MGLLFVVLFFFGLLFLWVLLPFLPGLTELRLKTDARPLQIVRESDVDIRHLARGFRELVKVPLDPLIERCRAEKRTETGRLGDGSPFIVFGSDGDERPIEPDGLMKPCRQVILSGGDLRLPPGSVHLAEVYSAGSFEGGPGSVFRAVLAEGSLSLGRRSTSLRWLHAESDLRTAPDCRLFGRASADGAMRLSGCCRFERLHAPQIEFGKPRGNWELRGNGKPRGSGEPRGNGELREIGEPRAPLRTIKPSDIPGLIEARASRWLIKGKLQLAANSSIANDLVVTGPLQIGAGTRIEGSIKSHGDLRIARGVTVTGSVIGERNIELGPDCRIGGPIVAEREIAIAPGCVVGHVDRPSTVNAKRIRVAPGVLCHGTVWALEDGALLGASHAVAPLEEPMLRAAGSDVKAEAEPEEEAESKSPVKPITAPSETEPELQTEPMSQSRPQPERKPHLLSEPKPQPRAELQPHPEPRPAMPAEKPRRADTALPIAGPEAPTPTRKLALAGSAAANFPRMHLPTGTRQIDGPITITRVPSAGRSPVHPETAGEGRDA